jgi:catechol 2,3-dioxygenase-like lactoylglutathione lyase family enzyme
MVNVSGINHIAFLTSDLDRLTGFYEELFGPGRWLSSRFPSPRVPADMR